MSLGPRNCPRDLHIVINDTVIEQKSEITLLGVTLDDQLSLSSHVSNVCRKASCQTGVLLRLRNLIPTSAKLHIVKHTTSSHILSDCLAFLSFFWCQKTRTNSRTSTTRTTRCLLWQQFDVWKERNYQHVIRDDCKPLQSWCMKSKMVWCLLTLRNSDFTIPRFRTVNISLWQT